MEEVIGGLIGLTAIIAIFIVLPWMVMNHSSKRRDQAARLAGDPAMNSDLMRLADKLEKRVQSLETILDAEVPGWRKMDRREH